ncbi:MAG TPA: flagellar filament capping protein FliD [Sphingomonadaceae bacterium]|nr:flagellar filament capping protein FliD [Sphingomonadaceae bacterium]
MATTAVSGTGTTSAASSIAATLGVGSGIDTASLVTNLVNAVQAPKEAQLEARETQNAAKVSGLADAANAIDSFASALSTLLSGGSLYTQPTSSDTSILDAKALAGSRISGLSSTIEVLQLAQAQTLVSGNLASAGAPVGLGSLTLTLGSVSATITIDQTNNSLTGLAKAINASAMGITATVVQDTQGARLMLKGVTGEAKAFTLTAGANADADLARFTYAGGSGGMTLAQAAQDAKLRVDGVDVSRSSNSFSDLLPGVQMDLRKAAPGTVVSLGTSSPADAIRQAVNDMVDAYNQLKTTLDAATAPKNADGTGGGALRGDPGIRDMQARLAKITLTVLSSTGSGPRTLAEIGVKTGRDGSLSLDTARLDQMLASDPAGVEALFNPTQSSSSPLITITSAMGKAKPGTYTLENIVAGPPPSGMINGVPAIASGTRLIAAANSGVAGLVIEPLGDVANATITVDPGLGGALQAIRDALRASTGSLTSSQTAAAAETKRIAEDREKLEASMTAYHDRLVTQFTAMDAKVAAFKATQSYLEQQIKVWTNSND